MLVNHVHEVGHYANTCPKKGEKKETEVLKIAYDLGYEPLEDSDIDSDIEIYAYTNSKKECSSTSNHNSTVGVRNQGIQLNTSNMDPCYTTLDDLALSLFKVYTGSSKIGSGPGRTEKVRINYYSKNFLIYSHFQEKINEVQMKALADFEDQFETFSGLLAPLPEDLKQLLCGHLSRTPRHHCQYCDEGVNIPMTEG
ncbi:hypothetical protein Tco_0553271 [Tanacetum coccineum]